VHFLLYNGIVHIFELTGIGRSFLLSTIYVYRLSFIFSNYRERYVNYRLIGKIYRDKYVYRVYDAQIFFSLSLFSLSFVMFYALIESNLFHFFFYINWIFFFIFIDKILRFLSLTVNIQRRAYNYKTSDRKHDEYCGTSNSSSLIYIHILQYWSESSFDAYRYAMYTFISL